MGAGRYRKHRCAGYIDIYIYAELSRTPKLLMDVSSRQRSVLRIPLVRRGIQIRDLQVKGKKDVDQMC